MKLNQCLLTLYLSTTSYQLYAGETIKPIEPIMATIAAGSFEMGSLKRESTQPIHTVNIKEFSMGKFEVTVNEFRQFIEATNYAAPQTCRHQMNAWFLESSTGNWQTNALNTSEFQPVVCIDWQAANAYAQWLAKETGKPYRLPSEAEWEYAARAGTKTDYYFGEDPENKQVCEYANVADLRGENILQRDSNTSYYNWSGKIANCTDHSAYASIVGMYKPNAFGLFDVLSNVQEFLADCYKKGYDHVAGNGLAYTSENCQQRSIRGGSWHWSHAPLVQRSAIPEDFAGGVDGFRLALDGEAPILSTTSKAFLSRLTFSQQQEKKRRELQPSIPDPVTNLALKQVNNLVILTWDKSKQRDVESYRVYRNELSKGMVKLLASNLTDTTFTHSNAEQHKYYYVVVAMRQHVQSNYSDPVSTQAGWINISNKIEAEWAVEISDSAISFSSDERGGSVLTGPDGIPKKAIMKYQVNVPSAGHYKLEYRVSASRDTRGFELYNNDQKLGTNPVLKTGGYHEWQTQQGITLDLKQGKNTLVLKSLDNNWTLNWLALKQH